MNPGSAYVDFLTDHLKPYMDRVYRTRPEPEQTAIMGSSLGGLISLFAGWRRPDVFGRIGGVSPSVMWSMGRLFEAWQEHSHKWSRIYLDVGDQERIYRDHLPLNYADSVQSFYDQLKSLGYGDHELRLIVEAGGGHHESDWKRRLPEAFAWLLS
jgi:predicted alpha/beta superfamily hydrolase